MMVTVKRQHENNSVSLRVCLCSRPEVETLCEYQVVHQSDTRPKEPGDLM